MMDLMTSKLQSYAGNLVILGALCTAVLRLVEVMARFGWMICSVAAVSLNWECAPNRTAAGDATLELRAWSRCGSCLQYVISWWRHQMEIFSALLALCAGNSAVTGEFLSKRPVTRSFDVFFDQRLSKRLSKQSWGWRFETPSRSLWRHCNAYMTEYLYIQIVVSFISSKYIPYLIFVQLSPRSVYQYLNIHLETFNLEVLGQILLLTGLRETRDYCNWWIITSR